MKTFKPSLKSSPFFHQAPSLPALMWQVCAALSLGIFVKALFFGWIIVGNLLVAASVAIGVEALWLALRKLPLKPALDGSATLTALLLTLSLPTHAPLWLVIVAVWVAIWLGKQLYGGLGMNPFNPAMLSFALCLVSFPVLMSSQQSALLDGTTGATLLDASRQLRTQSLPLNTQAFPLLPTLCQNLAWLLGWAWLVKKRFVDSRITIAMLLSALLVSTLFWLYDSSRYLNPFHQLLYGALIFGACFIATDPTTAATTKRGRYLYGALIGALVIGIRNLGQYPDGVAFAVLFGNALAPIIDPLTRPQYR
ncbi:MAG: RnfABCDGE type electron transport complex subunit D [Cardiobacteriaceae bacterium]|nr:RnfABCDGE type electron transport complex subunit D [Cardiobacteriaceae bacterium]